MGHKSGFLQFSQNLQQVYLYMPDGPGQSTPAMLGKICPDEYAMHLWALAYDRMD